MTASIIDDATTLHAYFFEELERARQRTGRDVPDEVCAYVVHMMSEFATRTDVAGRTSAPLAIEFLDARQRTGNARRSALRAVGDRALYIAGVVPKSLDRRGIGVHYADAIGRTAYEEVAEPSGPLSVFAKLARRFGEIAALIAEAVERAPSSMGDDLLAVYERWKAHGHEVDLRRLVRAGVLIDPDRDEQVH
ncbi:MAG: hypothetical protein D6705_06445 [Deltaproteobacteria bacterium]|nr:MAG: hypothetical protein D6705_06445 [Deltaproteobacteria bacterium]